MKRKLIYLLLILGLIISVVISLGVGAMGIPLKEVVTILAVKLGISKAELVPQYETVLMLVRMPRIVLGLFVGAALGISGAAIQGIFRNPLAEPGLIGISAGASLFAVLAITLEVTLLSGLGNISSYYMVSTAAFFGAGLSAMLVYQLSKSDGKPNVATMLLAGIAINALAGALTGLITASAEEQQLRSITFWMLGSLAGANWQTLISVIPFIIIPLIWLPLQGQKLNAFVLGEKQADQLGIRTSKVKLLIVILSTLAVGASVAVAGIIGFVGLLVPHMVRLMGGVDNKYVLPASALMGALVLCVADILARMLTAPIEQPIGVVTALIGTPVFLYILIRDKKKLLN